MIAIFTLVIFWLHALTAFVADDWSYASNHLTYQVIPDKISTQPMDNLFHRINDSNPRNQLDCDILLHPQPAENRFFLECLTKEDHIAIEKVILNRGNCSSPTDTISPAEAIPIINNLPMDVQVRVKALIKMSLEGLSDNSPKTDLLMNLMHWDNLEATLFNPNINSPDQLTTANPEILKQIKTKFAWFIDVINNPRYNSFDGTEPTVYKFGDRFAFMISCPNLIEMEIDITDGRKLKYTFQ